MFHSNVYNNLPHSKLDLTRCDDRFPLSTTGLFKRFQLIPNVDSQLRHSRRGRSVLNPRNRIKIENNKGDVRKTTFWCSLIFCNVALRICAADRVFVVDSTVCFSSIQNIVLQKYLNRFLRFEIYKVVFFFSAEIIKSYVVFSWYLSGLLFGKLLQWTLTAL